MPNLNNLTTQDLQWGTANWSGQGYIDGLKMVWNSATSISVISGAAFIPSLNKNLPSLATLTLSGLSLTASTWYHVYLYLNAGVPAIECVTTAPAAPYYGTARAKTGDTSRRYIGSVLTDASGNIWNFAQNGLRINWYVDIAGGTTVFRALAGGSATTLTPVSLSSLVPISCKLAQLRFQNIDTGAASRFSNSDTGLVAPAALLTIPPNINGTAFVDFPLSASQGIQYFLNGTPGGQGCYIDVLGYVYER